MSFGDKNPNNWFDLIQALVIGIAFLFFGIWAATDRFIFSFMEGLIDLGKYHRLIGLGSIAFGSVYLFFVIKNYSKET